MPTKDSASESDVPVFRNLQLPSENYTADDAQGQSGSEYGSLGCEGTLSMGVSVIELLCSATADRCDGGVVADGERIVYVRRAS